MEFVRPTKGGDDVLMRDHVAVLSNIARQRNMICSAGREKISLMENTRFDHAHERLRWARFNAGYREAGQFAERAGINATTYRSYENGQNGFAKYAALFSKILGVSMEWLMHGTGTAMAGESTAETNADDVQFVRQLEIGFSMGGGAFLDGYAQTGIVPFQRNWLKSVMRGSFDQLFVSQGEGDSMHPTIFDGDAVLIDTAQNRIDKQDRLWCIAYGELGMIKRVRRMPSGGYQIISDNPTVQPFTAHDDEMHVIGRVIWIGRRM